MWNREWEEYANSWSVGDDIGFGKSREIGKYGQTIRVLLPFAVISQGTQRPFAPAGDAERPGSVPTRERWERVRGTPDSGNRPASVRQPKIV
jgi:hypothetical protein